jgi:hypothetical protein
VSDVVPPKAAHGAAPVQSQRQDQLDHGEERQQRPDHEDPREQPDEPRPLDEVEVAASHGGAPAREARRLRGRQSIEVRDQAVHRLDQQSGVLGAAQQLERAALLVLVERPPRRLATRSMAFDRRSTGVRTASRLSARTSRKSPTKTS